MLKIIGIIAFIVAAVLAGYSGVETVSFFKKYWSSPWPQISGLVATISVYLFINGVIYRRILFRKQFEKNTPVFEVTDEYGVITYPEDTPEKIEWALVNQIEIVTSSHGPFAEDFWWLFYLSGQDEPVSVPQGVRDQNGHYDSVQKIHKILEAKFAGFDFDQIRQAIGSTSEAKFLVWSSNTLL